ncbi:MAG: carboxypeptidase regulatory-like domain-containing protein [Candidatus Acidiferrales bacterium]
MKTRLVLGVCLFALLGVLAIGEPAWGQTGSIRGSVKDQSGAVVPGAQVTITLAGTDTSRFATSDKDGSFEFVDLAVGHYDVTVDSPGFKKFVITDVVVDIGHVATVSANLQVGASAQTVTVQSEAAQVETTNTQLGGVMNSQAVTELPLSTRNTYQLLQLQPGVQSQVGADLFYGSDSPGVVSVNGGRGRSNNYMVNGGDGNDIFVNLPAIQPSPDAIEEFRVLTNTFDAEYGRNSGSIVNVVTKSGTNQLHGDFYEFFRNNILNTRGYFDPSVPNYKQNQFGATLGGPIKKDKTFIFGSYEGDRLRQGISSGTVILPSAQEAVGDFSASDPFVGTLVDDHFASILAARATGPSGQTCQQAVTAQGGTTIASGVLFTDIFPNNQIPIPCFDPTALAVYQNYVAPLGNSTVSFVPTRPTRDDQFTLRFDHKLNDSQQLTAYYYFDDDSRTEPFSTFQGAGADVPGFGSLFKTRVQQINIGHTWTIGTTAVNEFHFNYFREGQGNLDHPVHTLDVHDSCVTVAAAFCFQDPTDPNPQAGITTNIPNREGLPFIAVPGGFAVGNNFEGELPQTGNTFQWTDNYSKIIGKHSLKFGGDVRRQVFDQFLYFDIQGEYLYTSDSTLCTAPNQQGCDAPFTNDVGSGTSYPNYFIGAPSEYVQGAAQGENLRNTALYLFAQDSWKIKPSLTLNYGLRWELNTNYADTGNRLQTFRPGTATTKYSCLLNPSNFLSEQLIATYGSADCSPNGPANAVYPAGLEFPTDPSVPKGLTQTYYKGFAPRVGLAWSPGWTEGWLAKLTGGPGKSSVRMGWGMFYNPIEQLVMEQFSAEPPFGGSSDLSSTLFNLPFEYQSGGYAPNPFGGVIHQSPNSPCFSSSGSPGCVDFSNFRPMLLFGEFQPHLRTQFADQYNLTIERQLAQDLILRVGYVGTQGHRLLASHDLNIGNAATCLALNQIEGDGTCGEFGADSTYTIPGFTTLPVALPLPYNAGSGGSVIPAGTTLGPAGVTLVGLRKFSSPQCQPLTGTGCPADDVPVFGSIFAEDTIANSAYNALQVQLEKHFSRGLYFSFAYTWSKAMDQGASFENELNPIDFRLSRGLSLVDAKHRFVFSPYWELPIPKHSGFVGKVVNGWAVSGIVTFQSGFPIRMNTQDDPELEFSVFFESANTPQLTGPLTFSNPRKPGNVWFSGNISDPALGSFGNMPHSLCCGPTISNSDIAIEKKTPITERFSAEFRAEFFNAWNHTQFANPDGNFSDGLPEDGGTFGQILKTREDPRVIQFGLKILF